MYYIDSCRGNTYIHRNTYMCVCMYLLAPQLSSSFLPSSIRVHFNILIHVFDGLCKILRLSKGVLNGEALFFLIT